MPWKWLESDSRRASIYKDNLNESITTLVSRILMLAEPKLEIGLD